MQAAIKVSLAGQTFALPRCSDSPGKKTRNRRTKEERKTMVESFIKKYQNSNNGSFPSLNLTHKEVGGSFYTVREIVREIIQENKVLGPGNPNSQVLTLDDCVEPLSLEPGSHLSLAIDGQSVEEIEKEAVFVSSQHQVHKEDMIMAEGDQDSNIYINSYHYKSSQVVDCDILDVNKDVTEQPQQERCNFQGDERVNIEDQTDDGGDSEIHKIEHPVQVSHGNFENSESETMLQMNSEINESIGSTGLAYMGNIVSEITETDSSEKMISVYKEVLTVSDESKNHSSSSQPEEDFELSSISTFGGSSKQTSLVKEGSIITSEALESSDLTKEKNADVFRSLSEEVNINRPHSVGEEIDIAGNVSSNISDDKLAQNLTPVLDISDLPTSETAEGEVESMLQANDTHTGKANISSGTVSYLSHGHKSKSEFEVRTELMHSSNSSESGSNSLSYGVSSEPSEDAYKHQESQETNHVVSAIKGFFAAVVKFFTE